MSPYENSLCLLFLNKVNSKKEFVAVIKQNKMSKSLNVPKLFYMLKWRSKPFNCLLLFQTLNKIKILVIKKKIGVNFTITK